MTRSVTSDHSAVAARLSGRTPHGASSTPRVTAVRGRRQGHRAVRGRAAMPPACDPIAGRIVGSGASASPGMTTANLDDGDVQALEALGYIDSGLPVKLVRRLANLGYGTGRRSPASSSVDGSDGDGHALEPRDPDPGGRCGRTSPHGPRPPLVVMLHKPTGLVTSRSEAGNRPCTPRSPPLPGANPTARARRKTGQGHRRTTCCSPMKARSCTASPSTPSCPQGVRSRAGATRG